MRRGVEACNVGGKEKLKSRGEVIGEKLEGGGRGRVQRQHCGEGVKNAPYPKLVTGPMAKHGKIKNKGKAAETKYRGGVLKR